MAIDDMFHLLGSGGVGNHELIHDFAMSAGPAHSFRIHAAIKVPRATAETLRQMIQARDFAQMVPWLMANGEFVVDADGKAKFRGLLSAMCAIYAKIPVEAPADTDRFIPGYRGVPSFRVIDDFTPTSGQAQSWFELRVILPFSASSAGTQCKTDLENNDFASAMNRLKNGAADYDTSRIGAVDFQAMINAVYQLS